MEINKSELQERVKALASKRGESLKDVARACGLGVNALYQSDNLTASALVKIAEHLECSVDYILGRAAWLDGEECNALIDKIIEGVPLADLVRQYGSDFVVHYDSFRSFADRLKAEREEARKSR